MHVGPLGSTIHVLRADAGTIAEFAVIDWTRSFRRVCLDPVGGLIVLMTPSRLHDELATVLDHVVDIAASTLSGAVTGLRTARLREPGAPPGTGMEPDCAFYVGGNARAYREALSSPWKKSRNRHERGIARVVALTAWQWARSRRRASGRRCG